MLLVPGCGGRSSRADLPDLVGSWRASVQFESGAFAAIKDLQFFYVFNAGGTMTESSNYDGAPPVPPAYRVWRATGAPEYEARYQFFSTRPPATLADIGRGGGWLPAGYGVLTEHIRLAHDRRSYQSTIEYHAFDQAGHPAPGSGRATARAVRFGF